MPRRSDSSRLQAYPNHPQISELLNEAAYAEASAERVELADPGNPRARGLRQLAQRCRLEAVEISRGLRAPQPRD